jgi:AcrR family transcriptional regulator
MPRSAILARPAKLSAEGIVDAALVIIERDGLASLSTRKVAAVLGCEAMSLYHYFRNIDMLLDAVVDALLATLPVEPKPEKTAGDDLRDSAIAYLALADSRPNAFQLVATRRWRTPHALAAVRYMVDCFARAGFTPEQALRKSRILAAYMNGAGLALAAWRLSDGQVLAEVSETFEAMDPAILRPATIRDDLHTGLRQIVAVVLRP